MPKEKKEKKEPTGRKGSLLTHRRHKHGSKGEMPSPDSPRLSSGSGSSSFSGHQNKQVQEGHYTELRTAGGTSSAEQSQPGNDGYSAFLPGRATGSSATSSGSGSTSPGLISSPCSSGSSSVPAGTASLYTSVLGHVFTLRFGSSKETDGQAKQKKCLVCAKYVWPLQLARGCRNCQICVHADCDLTSVQTNQCHADLGAQCAILPMERHNKKSRKIKVPNSVEAAIQMSEACIDESGDFSRARAFLSAGMEKFPEATPLLVRLIQLMFDCRAADTKVMFSELQYRAPHLVDMYLLKALLEQEAKINSDQKVAESLRQAMESDSGHPLAVAAWQLFSERVRVASKPKEATVARVVAVKLNSNQRTGVPEPFRAYDDIVALFTMNRSVKWGQVETILASRGVRFPRAASVLFSLTQAQPETPVSHANWSSLQAWHREFVAPGNAFAWLLAVSARREFVGFVDTSTAIQALVTMKAGAWLLRSSSQAGALTLSAKSTLSMVDHKRIQVQELPGNSFRLAVADSPGSPEFDGPDALDQLLNHARKHSLYAGKDIRLTESIKRPDECFVEFEFQSAPFSASTSEDFYSYTPASGPAAVSEGGKITYPMMSSDGNARAAPVSSASLGAENVYGLTPSHTLSGAEVESVYGRSAAIIAGNKVSVSAAQSPLYSFTPASVAEEGAYGRVAKIVPQLDANSVRSALVMPTAPPPHPDGRSE